MSYSKSKKIHKNPYLNSISLMQLLKFMIIHYSNFKIYFRCTTNLKKIIRIKQNNNKINTKSMLKNQ